MNLPLFTWGRTNAVIRLSCLTLGYPVLVILSSLVRCQFCSVLEKASSSFRLVWFCVFDPSFFTSLGELRNEVMFWLWFLVGLVIVYSKWWGWYGGWCWGPRFFLFGSIIASLALALVITEENKGVWTNVISLSVLALSIWVGISGAAFGQRGLEICAQE